MGRLGRPRKQGQRFACGKLRPTDEEIERRKTPRGEVVEPTPETMARRIALFGDYKAAREEVCPLDRLGKQITEDQYHAGRYARAVYARYCIAIHAPRTVAGQMRDYIQGGGSSSMDADAARAAVDEYLDLINAVRRYSYRSMLELQRIMHGSPPRSVDTLAIGLTALADHLGFSQAA